MMFAYLDKLLNGEVGEVIYGDDWNYERECMVIDGEDYELGEMVSGIDEFLEENGVENLKLFRSDGYRGEYCYSGYMKIGDKEYSLEIMSDYVVYEITKVKK